MIFLAQQGHSVVGVELSPLAVEQFFLEQKLSKIPGPVTNSWQAKELPITLYCGDFFNMPAQLTASINAIYDRAAIIALPIAMRAQYAQVLKSLAQKKIIRYLLIAMEFNNSEIGPPFSVPQSEIQAHYGQQFTITFKTSTPFATSLPHHQAMGLHSFDEYCLELQARH
jgi:thiopurine S-methyltransferase